jgi:hypothetical protein
MVVMDAEPWVAKAMPSLMQQVMSVSWMTPYDLFFSVAVYQPDGDMLGKFGAYA